MVQSPQMHQLMEDDVVAHPRRHQDEPPIQADVTVRAAGSPARALIPDADAPHRQLMARRQLDETPRQLDRGARAECAPLLGPEPGHLDPGPLLCDPLQMPQPERDRLPPRPPARNRHAHAPIVLHAQYVPARAPVPHEVELDR